MRKAPSRLDSCFHLLLNEVDLSSKKKIHLGSLAKEQIARFYNKINYSFFQIYIDELTSSSGNTVMSNHGVGCRILAVLERTASNVVFVCMLVEGIYLHRLIVAVFKQKLNIKWLYVIGFGE